MNLENLLNNYGEAVAMILFGIGFTNLLLQKNLIKKIIGLNIMDTATYLFLALKGYIDGRKAPVVTDGVQSVYQPHSQRAGADGDRSVRLRDRADAGADHPPVPPISHAGSG